MPEHPQNQTSLQRFGTWDELVEWYQGRPIQGKIFVVDDDELVRESFVHLLSALDIPTATFGNAESLLEYLAEGHEADPLCLLVDQNLGIGLGGLDLIEEMRRRGLQIPAILMSGMLAPDQEIRAQSAGILDVFDKGRDPLELLGRLVTGLDKYHQEAYG